MKQNVILKAAVAAALGVAAAGAYAGQISANPSIVYAKQAVTSTGSATLGQFAYQTTSTLASGSPVQFVFTLGNAATFNATTTGITFAGSTTGVSAATNAAGQLIVTVTPSQSVASGQLLVVPTGVVVGSLTGALGTGAAGQLTVTANVVNAINVTIESATQQVLATSADAFTAVFSAGPETAKINVSNDKVLTGQVSASTTTAVVGKFVVTNNTIQTYALDGVTAISAATYNHAFTVKGKFANSTNVGGTTFLSTSATCATADQGAVVASTALSFATTVVAGNALVGAGVGTASTLYFCQAGNGSVSFLPVQYTGALTASTTGLATVSIADTNMFKLDYNGGVVRVSNFVGSDFASAGYQGFLRVVNSGSKAADISVAAYDPATGVLGTSAVVITALPAGASATVSTKDVETKLGTAFTGGVWRTLQVTGKTESLDAASLVVDPRGGLTNVSSIQGGANGSNQ
ncbi:hypothetical protein [Chitinimonas naiadis]